MLKGSCFLYNLQQIFNLYSFITICHSKEKVPLLSVYETINGTLLL